MFACVNMEISESPAHPVWKNDLYRWQLNAPVPIPIVCEKNLENVPGYLGQDYHGSISNTEIAQLLDNKPNGAYLARDSKTSRTEDGQFYTLSLKFNNKIHHYKLYHDSGGLYVSHKRYDCVRSLVADGLVTMYLQLKAPQTLQTLQSINYQESPYMTLNKRKLRVLSKEYAKNNNLFALPQPEDIPCTNEKFEKPHQFKITTFKGLNWCELCGNFLWGFTAQGVRCDDCGTAAHEKCSKKFSNDCVPHLKYLRGVFGIELTTLLTAHNAKLPFVVTKCVQEVEARGLTVEGIYRLSGFAEEVECIKMTFDKDGDKADLSQEKYPNINAISGALKLYLRLLPIPLITFIVHPLLTAAMQNSKANEAIIVKNIKDALESLQKPHYDTLHYVINHLKRVSQHSAINKMTPHNLATVFAPTLIGPPISATTMLPDMTTDILVVENLIVYCDRVFSKPLETSAHSIVV